MSGNGRARIYSLLRQSSNDVHSGISGLFDEDNDDKSEVVPVVGVANTYRKPHRSVFGTDVAYVIDAIQNAANPSLNRTSCRRGLALAAVAG